jgi:c-type cytochrome biogenesis protein CcmF
MVYEVLIITSGFLVFLDFVLSSLKNNEKIQKNDYGLYFTLIGFFSLLFAYGFFLQFFINNDFSIVSVYSYSSSSLPLLTKIYASWGGASGSMLFLSMILFAIHTIFRIKAHKSNTDFWVFTCKIFSIILLVFILITLVKNPFEQYPSAPIEGRGLNPQLQTFWMFIHPPIVFGAYAFVLLTFSLALSAIKNNQEYSSSKVLKASVLVSWLLLTIGIALGGVWAYEVLGWGGYWAWDPVETASLLPWLLLTAMFYVRPTKKIKTFSNEAMILLSFVSLVFLSALTRGGGVQSVHSYAISPVAPIMMTFALGMIFCFFYLKKQTSTPLFKMENYKTSVHSRSAAIIFWSLILIAIVCFIGLAFQDFSYNYYIFPFVLSLIVGLIGYSLDKNALFARVILLTILGLVSGFVLLQLFSLHVLASLGIPFVTIAIAIVGLNLVRVLRKKSLQNLGKSIITLGLVLILLGVFISAGTKSSGNIVDFGLDSPVETLGCTIKLTNFEVGASNSMVYYPELDDLIFEYSFVTADSTIQYIEKTYTGTLLAEYYPNYGLVVRPQIIGTAMGDLYIHLDYNENLSTSLVQALRNEIIAPDAVDIVVQTSPMIYLLWIGIAVLILGITSQFVIELKQDNYGKTK